MCESPEDILRLDRFLFLKLKNFSRSLIQEQIRLGLILVNGKKKSPSLKLKIGDCVEILGEFQTKEIHLDPQPMPLDIIYEDDDILVINKPAGVIVHPGAGTKNKVTLIQGILYHTKKLSNVNDLRPGIVHRLDKDTSGGLVIAKNNIAHAFLAKQFHDKTNLREYTALCYGEIKEDQIIETYIKRDEKKRTTFKAIPLIKSDTSKLKKAISVFKKEITYHNLISLCNINLKTGRTHQIRVHAQFIQHPIIGDPIYQQHRRLLSKNFSPTTIEKIKNLNRQFLHAKRLGFVHPRTKKWMEFNFPLPKELQEILDLLNTQLVSK